MITPEYCQLMARYNRWMNERLYALLVGASRTTSASATAARSSARCTARSTTCCGATACGSAASSTSPAPCPRSAPTCSPISRSSRASARSPTGRCSNWAGSVTAPWLDGTLSYTSKVDGRAREMPRAVAVLQLFNHGTHHRGQLTTLISAGRARSRRHRHPVAARRRPVRRRARAKRAGLTGSARRAPAERRLPAHAPAVFRAGSAPAFPDQRFLRFARGCALS